MARKKIKRVLIALLIATVYTAFCFIGVLLKPNNALNDTLYQEDTALDGNVLLVGIDRSSLDELGPFNTWTRETFAQLIHTLNADPESKPAVIAIDTVFAGETTMEADSALADACAEYGNVIVASMAQFGTSLVENESGDFYIDPRAITGFDEPYDALKAVTRQGHINAMYDDDGILRHSLLEYDVDGQTILSFGYQAYLMYCEQMGVSPTTPKTDGDGFWYLPFKGLPGAYDEGASVAGVLSGEITSDWFADKIVVIGPYTAGLQDSYTTAIDHATPMYGVEYQSNIIDTLIAKDFKQHVPDWVQMLTLFLVLFIFAFIFLDRKIITSTVGWLLSVVAYLGICIFAYKSGFILDTLYIPLGISLVYIVTVGLNYVNAALEKSRVTSTFRRYVAPEIVAELLKDDKNAVSLGGKLCDIAVLFVDIRGFTTMSELLSPKEVVEILNRYLTLTSTCILNNKGTLDKFVGDATMAFWGAPLPQEDCVFKAVKTALDMVEGSKQLSAELQERFGRTVSFGIGVHYGPAVVGNIGSPFRMDYTAIGDTVNTSARLESNAPGGTVLVSRVVADFLKGRVEFESLGDSIKLKGKSDGFEILKATEMLGE